MLIVSVIIRTTCWSKVVVKIQSVSTWYLNNRVTPFSFKNRISVWRLWHRTYLIRAITTFNHKVIHLLLVLFIILNLVQRDNMPYGAMNGFLFSINFFILLKFTIIDWISFLRHRSRSCTSICILFSFRHELCCLVCLLRLSRNCWALMWLGPH